MYKSNTVDMDTFRIEGKIGGGAHGVVLKAKNIRTGDTVRAPPGPSAPVPWASHTIGGTHSLDPIRPVPLAMIM